MPSRSNLNSLRSAHPIVMKAAEAATSNEDWAAMLNAQVALVEAAVGKVSADRSLLGFTALTVLEDRGFETETTPGMARPSQTDWKTSTTHFRGDLTWEQSVHAATHEACRVVLHDPALASGGASGPLVLKELELASAVYVSERLHGMNPATPAFDQHGWPPPAVRRQAASQALNAATVIAQTAIEVQAPTRLESALNLTVFDVESNLDRGLDR